MRPSEVVHRPRALVSSATEDPLDGTQEQLLAGEIDQLLSSVRNDVLRQK